MLEYLESGTYHAVLLLHDPRVPGSLDESHRWYTKFKERCIKSKAVAAIAFVTSGEDVEWLEAAPEVERFDAGNLTKLRQWIVGKGL